jgi:hypothetical protein
MTDFSMETTFGANCTLTSISADLVSPEKEGFYLAYGLFYKHTMTIIVMILSDASTMYVL